MCKTLVCGSFMDFVSLFNFLFYLNKKWRKMFNAFKHGLRLENLRKKRYYRKAFRFNFNVLFWFTKKRSALQFCGLYVLSNSFLSHTEYVFDCFIVFWAYSIAYWIACWSIYLTTLCCVVMWSFFIFSFVKAECFFFFFWAYVQGFLQVMVINLLINNQIMKSLFSVYIRSLVNVCRNNYGWCFYFPHFRQPDFSNLKKRRPTSSGIK